MTKLGEERSRGRRAVQALEHALKNAGLDPYLNITVGHYNAVSEDIEEQLCRLFF